MKNKKFIIKVAIILFFGWQYVPLLAATAQHGPIFKMFYSFYGYAISEVPYEEGDDVGSVATSPKDGETFNSIAAKSITLGYFYSWAQAEFIYKNEVFKNQVTDQADTGEILNSDSGLKIYEFKLGKRFNIAGETSYNFLYIGYKYFKMTSDLANARIKGRGMTFGTSGMQGFGLDSGLEFVIAYDFYCGLYKNNSLSFDRDIDPEITNSLTIGSAFGAGLQYEPYNIAVLFKVAPEYDTLRYKGSSGQSIDVDVNLAAAYIGIECIYTIPNYKYNERQAEHKK